MKYFHHFGSLVHYAAIAIGIAALAMNASTAAAETTMEKAKASGYVRVGFANEAPFGFATPKGKLTGEAPEIAKVILKKMGIEQVDGVLTQFRGLIPGLQAKRFDIIAAGMFVRPKRCKQVLFTEPTYGIGQAMIVKSGNPKNIHGYDDIANNQSLKLGVIGGGAAHKYAQAVGIDDNRISVYPDGPSGRAAVDAGRIDAWAMTSLAVQRLIDSAGNTKVERATPFKALVIDGEEKRGHGAFAFRKEDAAFRDEFNKHLKAFLGSPEHFELVRSFGFTKADAPSKTLTELCGD
ncbi:MAG: ectoine/hydroxyectoine ABC transporter substrate-binding protein EhuB [Planctomycetota bacterium]